MLICEDELAPCAATSGRDETKITISIVRHLLDTIPVLMLYIMIEYGVK